MPRKARKAPGGIVFHCINRGVGRNRLFHKPQDYAAFERVMAYALEAVPVRLLAYCLMPNHWHLLLWPEEKGQVGKIHAPADDDPHTPIPGALPRSGTRAPLSEPALSEVEWGRFKSFPVQEDRHFLTVARYVERNALRAGLAQRAEQWPWGSLWRRTNPGARLSADADGAKAIERCGLPLSPWPVRGRLIIFNG